MNGAWYSGSNLFLFFLFNYYPLVPAFNCDFLLKKSSTQVYTFLVKIKIIKPR